MDEPELNIHSFIFFIPCIFAEHLLCANYCWGDQRCSSGHNKHPCHHVPTIYWADIDNKLTIRWWSILRSKGDWESVFIFFFFFFFFFLSLCLRHMGVPRLGVESELQLKTYTAATAIKDLSCIWDFCRSLQQLRVLNPLTEARDRTLILTETVGFLTHWTTTGTPVFILNKKVPLDRGLKKKSN